MIIAVALQVAFGNVQQWASLSAAYLDVRNFRTEPPSPYNIAPGKGPVPKAASEILQSFYDKFSAAKFCPLSARLMLLLNRASFQPIFDIMDTNRN